jgi:hypothetical protein
MTAPATRLSGTAGRNEHQLALRLATLHPLPATEDCQNKRTRCDVRARPDIGARPGGRTPPGRPRAAACPSPGPARLRPPRSRSSGSCRAPRVRWWWWRWWSSASTWAGATWASACSPRPCPTRRRAGAAGPGRAAVEARLEPHCVGGCGRVVAAVRRGAGGGGRRGAAALSWEGGQRHGGATQACGWRAALQPSQPASSPEHCRLHADLTISGSVPPGTTARSS